MHESKLNVLLFARYLYLIMNYLLLDSERSEICICFTTVCVLFFIFIFLPVNNFSLRSLAPIIDDHFFILVLVGVLR